MSRRTQTIGPEYFERLYTENPDPWQFATSPYEQEKYAATLAALPEGHFASGLEIGCSIGILTRQLAARCANLLSVDVSETALAEARKNCAGLAVRFENRRIPGDWPPEEKFELIVFSEVLYYLAPADLRATAALATAALAPGGTVLMVHYLGITDYPLAGDQAANMFIDASGLSPSKSVTAPLYRIDVLHRAD